MLTVENLTKVYRRGRHDHQALNGISTTFEPGFTALIGPNGGGKSTLLSIIATLNNPTTGTVLFKGSPALRNIEEYRKHIGFVPQHPKIPSHMTTRSLLEYIGWAHGINTKDTKHHIASTAEKLGLTAFLDKKAGALSGGQFRRLAIAMGTFHNPDIILLDEPTVGLDPDHRVRVREMVHSLADEAAVIMSTHLLEDIRSDSTKIKILADGEIRFSGQWNELANSIPTGPGIDQSRAFELAYSDLVTKTNN